MLLCALRRTTAAHWSDCCVTAPAHRLLVIGCARRAATWSFAAPNSTPNPLCNIPGKRAAFDADQRINSGVFMRGCQLLAPANCHRHEHGIRPMPPLSTL